MMEQRLRRKENEKFVYVIAKVEEKIHKNRGILNNGYPLGFGLLFVEI